ncbi:MAG TPA: alpha/beta fold hydrolase [Candidatus Elarobacter sp.]
MRSAAVWLALGLVCTTPLGGSAATAPLHTKPCNVGKTAAICGTLTVHEDRANATGRTIALHFIVLRAVHPSHRALAFNPGGPGGSAIDAAPVFTDGPFSVLRDRHDIVLVDNRGTGASAPQQCDFAPPDQPASYFMQLWPDALVQRCRDRLAAHADLSQYASPVAADDLDDVRAALGYDKLALFGGSYGTRFALVYARQHPDRVESLLLLGVAPPHYYVLPLPMAAGAQASINELFTACRAEAACAKAFPSLREHFAALVRRFDTGPVPVPLQSPAHRGQTVRLSKEVFAEAIRHALYGDDGVLVPAIVERAYHGNYAALSALADQMVQQFAGEQATGLNLSVTCAEDIPFITEDAVVRTSANSFEGDARVRAQQRACRIWNVHPVPASFIEPVASDLPVFMISGDNDPATPPSYAKEALANLPHARMMLVRGASHQTDYPPCVYAAAAAFLRSPTAAQPNLAGCAAAYRRPSIATLTYFDSAPGENPAMTARSRTFFTRLMSGRLDRSQLTPKMSKDYSAAVLSQIASEISSGGPMESFVYRGSRRSGKGTAYRYLAHLVRATAIVTITLDSAGKTADLDISPI